MKFAICNETFQDWPLDRACEFAAECGYTGLEIAPFTLDPEPLNDLARVSGAERTRVRRVIEAAGLEPIGLHWLLAKTSGLHVTSPDPAVRARTSQYLGDLARLCRDLGGSIMVFGSPQQRNLPPGVSLEQGTAYAAEVFADALTAFEQTGVTVAIEPLGPAEGDFLTTAGEAARLIERIGSSHCRLHLDVKAMSSERIPIPQLIQENRSLLAHFHANDPNRQGPGFGEVDFVPILSALGEIDYRGWVSVEVFDYSPGVERLAEESIDYMRDCLETIAGGS